MGTMYSSFCFVLFVKMGFKLVNGFSHNDYNNNKNKNKNKNKYNNKNNDKSNNKPFRKEHH